MIWFKETCRFPDTVHYYDAFEYMFVLSKGKPKTINLIADKPNKWAGTKLHGTGRQQNGTTTRKTGHNKREIKDFGVRYNMWTIHNPGKRNNPHPATFPEKLAEDHIISWSNENDIVFDPFMGSGTTAKMAQIHNRKFLGFEISPEYIQLANIRLESINEDIK
jgi:DNA modification methylase